MIFLLVIVTSNMNQTIKAIFSAIDKTWMRRRRLIDTMSIITAVHQSAIRHRGLNHILQLCGAPFSAAALCKARQKLPEGCFRKAICDFTSVDSTNRVFAVDGSKVHMPASFVEKGFTSRTNNQPVSRPARRPLCMLNSVVDVHTKACVDFTVTSHFNERKAFVALLDNNKQYMKAGDTFIFDRGYYSAQVVTALYQRQMEFIFRLKKDAFAGVKQFFNSRKTYCKTKVGECSVALVKYVIEGKTYVCLTSPGIEVSLVKGLYKRRWKVEEHFKRLKSYLSLERVLSTSSSVYLQDVDIRIFLDWVALGVQKKKTKTSHILILDRLPLLLEWRIAIRPKVSIRALDLSDLLLLSFFKPLLTPYV